MDPFTKPNHGGPLGNLPRGLGCIPALARALHVTSESAQPFTLVVDDDPMILMDACAIIEYAGVRPLEAHTGDAAIELSGRHDGQVDLLFNDVQMPGSRDGFALARETATRWPHFRILVASVQATPRPGDLP